VIKTSYIFSSVFEPLFKKNQTKHDLVIRFAREMRHFKDTETGREIIIKAHLAGVCFVLMDENGDPFEYLGDRDAKTMVPIYLSTIQEIKDDLELKKEDKIDLDGYYMHGDNDIHLRIEGEGVVIAQIIMQAMIHEMQHAIDHNSDTEDLAEFTKLFDTSQASGKLPTDEEISKLEKWAEKWIENRVRSEVDAHDIGNENAGMLDLLYKGYELNRQDGVYTYSEKLHVLETQEYAQNTYKPQLDKILEELYPNGPHFESEVYLEKDGTIRVKISVKE
jgi:hypothetical protein